MQVFVTVSSMSNDSGVSGGVRHIEARRSS
jgi:hypothetical protein